MLEKIDLKVGDTVYIHREQSWCNEISRSAEVYEVNGDRAKIRFTIRDTQSCYLTAEISTRYWPQCLDERDTRMEGCEVYPSREFYKNKRNIKKEAEKLKFDIGCAVHNSPGLTVSILNRMAEILAEAK